MKNLLINWVYYRPVGHVVEAMRLARDFAAADPTLEISLLLNEEAPAELARCLRDIAHVYSVDLRRASSPRGFPEGLPRDWDYVFTDPRAATERLPRDLGRFHEAFRHWVRPRSVNDGWNESSMPPRKYAPLRLDLPAEERAKAAARVSSEGSPRLTVLPAPASPSRAPSMRFWGTFFDELFSLHPTGEVFLLGAFDEKRSHSGGITARDIAALRERFPQVRDAFDVPLLEQLAIAELSGLHVSPHSGMSFAVQAVGTPWLAISGQQWHEFIYNGVPLVSIFPECPLYPCFREMYDDCRSLIRHGRRTPCMDDDALLAKMPDIITAMEALLAGEISYETVVRSQEQMLRQRLGPDSWCISDWPHVVADDYRF